MATISDLREDLESLVEDFAELLADLPVKRSQLRSGRGVVVVAPDNTWGEFSVSQKASLLLVKRRYEEWLQQFRSAIGPFAKDLAREIQNADEGVRKWIELDVSWGLSLNPSANVKNMRGSADGYFEILAVLEQAGLD